MTGDPVQCTCPAAWWGTVPPTCAVHNPQSYMITTTGTGTDWAALLKLTSTPSAAAWTCPRCNKVNAPHVNQCPCPPTGALAPLKEWPVTFPIPEVPPCPLMPTPDHWWAQPGLGVLYTDLCAFNGDP